MTAPRREYDIFPFILAEPVPADYIRAMSTFLPFLMGFAMFATLIILVVGLVGFARNGPFYKKHANNLMRARVVGQGVALILFALIMFLAAR